MSRLLDATWWKRKIIKRVRTLWEYAAQLLQCVGWGSEYVSDATLEDHLDMQYAAQQWINESVLVRWDPVSGQDIVLPMGKLVAARKKGWLAEQHARANGVAKLAIEEGLTPWLVTITMASRWHASGKGDRPSTEEAVRWHQTQWSRFRAAAKKNGLRLVGPKVVEPHKDGCPHWHLVVWTDDKKSAEQLLSIYFLDADDPGEPGAADHRIAWEQARSNMGAISYILKYALKYSMETNAGPDSRARLAVNAWRSLYGLRKLDWFSVNIAQPKVGVWREARRANHCPTSMNDAIDAAGKGDWYAFTKACISNPLFLRSELVANKHGEYTSRTIGIRDDRGSLITTRSYNWKIMNVETWHRLQSLCEGVQQGWSKNFAVPPAVFSWGGGPEVTDNHNKPRAPAQAADCDFGGDFEADFLGVPWHDSENSLDWDDCDPPF